MSCVEREGEPMGKAASGASSEELELYDRLVRASDLERRGASMPYTSVNGHMFSFLTKDGKLALRLPAEERDAFLKKYDTKLCEQHGSVLEEYVEVPDALLRRTEELKSFFERSLAHVSSLAPKPTKRTSKAPAKKTPK